jgi:uroporphyrinogen-III synthase
VSDDQEGGGGRNGPSERTLHHDGLDRNRGDRLGAGGKSPASGSHGDRYQPGAGGERAASSGQGDREELRAGGASDGAERRNAAAPLAGVRVVVTRAERQAADLAAAFAAAGAVVEALPLLEVSRPADPAPLARAAAELPLFDWVVFTSANAVQALLALAGGTLPPRLRVAAVGDATAAALRGQGVEPGLLAAPKGQSAAGLLAALLHRLGCGERVLLPQAADALPTLREGLLAAGIAAVAVTAYEKGLPAAAAGRAAELFAATPIGWVTFTSPSVVRNFAALFGDAWETRRGELLAASLGPVTSAELRRLGVEPRAEAERPEPAALVAAVVGAGAIGADRRGRRGRRGR